MKDSYRYEAAVLGDSLAALFAGYILKQNRIHFVFLDSDKTEPRMQESIQKNEKAQIQNQEQKFPYRITEEGMHLVNGIYQRLSAQVGVSNPDADVEIMRLRTFLVSEMQTELANKKQVSNISFSNGYVLIECDSGILDADVLIAQEDILSAGFCAQAVMEEKERRLEEYMKRLRIRQGKRTHRKMVYVTHSKSWYYAKEIVMQFAIEQGVAAVNPFMNYGFYMNGSVEKDEVTECCHQLIRTADELWVFGPISEAILTDIAVAVMEGKEVHFFSISEHKSQINELRMEDIIFEREVHAGQIRKSDLLNFVRSTAPRNMDYIQMSLFD
ncbi:MAG: hypothetical protein ACI4E0_05635 [Blautia sp.]